ncbi:helix-turn-helix transcriptional regulator [Pseudonocardia cypriaca]|uniref:Putative DNA-binding transcriptional regulator YafY n=1 Tax=Pseudonocardia cypriaca TaxID=882449 RepID=A0A543FW43_9PSEU|nr:YafY family protein [Pseudonocardia cypriaca]TQM38041.1 putative DNA-binding transcriptional regulator YafY [Pseudonocardia cypriaca]
MLDTSARLLRLLSILQTPRDWTGAELAERLDVDVRTVRRDVDKLRALGYPVHAARGVAGYRLGAGTTLPPLLLDDEEAVAVAVGMRTAASGGVTGIEEASLRALTKLETVLPSRLRHRVDGLGAVTVTLPHAGASVDPDVLLAVAAAARTHEVLRFDYRGGDGAETARRTEPHRLVHSGRRWYLLAWDLDRADWRTFRVDRLHPRIPTGPRFVPRELPADLPGHVGRGITTRGYRYRARFTLHVPIEVAADRIAPTVGTLEAIDERSCVLHAGSDSLDELALYVGLFGFPFEVHEPPELVAHVRELAARLAAAADRP